MAHFHDHRNRVEGQRDGASARAFLDRHAAAVLTARVTGRRIFGQLWMPDPTHDDVMRAAYIDAIESGFYLSNPLHDYFNAHLHR